MPSKFSKLLMRVKVTQSIRYNIELHKILNFLPSETTIFNGMLRAHVPCYYKSFGENIGKFIISKQIKYYYL